MGHGELLVFILKTNPNLLKKFSSFCVLKRPLWSHRESGEAGQGAEATVEVQEKSDGSLGGGGEERWTGRTVQGGSQDSHLHSSGTQMMVPKYKKRTQVP